MTAPFFFTRKYAFDAACAPAHRQYPFAPTFVSIPKSPVCTWKYPPEAIFTYWLPLMSMPALVIVIPLTSLYAVLFTKSSV